jgi:hypothetical protein
MEDKEKIEQLESDISNERKRLSTDRLDISYGELINLYKNKELIINFAIHTYSSNFCFGR